MTDDTTAVADPDGDATSDDDDTGDASVDVAEADARDVAEQEAEPASAIPEWVDRYVVPIVMPLLIVVGLVFYVVNVSRMFLASPGAGAVTMAVTITVVILVGAALMSAAPKMRTSSMALIVLGGMIVILGGGSLTVGESGGEEEESAFPPDIVPAQMLEIFSANVFFEPPDLAADTGFAEITMTNVETGQHTFVFETPGVVTSKPELEVADLGDVDSYNVFIGEAGDYVFFCSIPGHREAGMEGILAIVGEAITLAEAEALAGGGDGGEGGEE